MFTSPPAIGRQTSLAVNDSLDPPADRVSGCPPTNIIFGPPVDRAANVLAAHWAANILAAHWAANVLAAHWAANDSGSVRADRLSGCPLQITLKYVYKYKYIFFDFFSKFSVLQTEDK